MEEVVPKMARRRDSVAGQSRRGELDPTVDVRMRCKNNFPTVLSCTGKMAKEGYDCGSEIGTVTWARREKPSSSEETGRIWKEIIMRKILFLGSITSVPYLAMKEHDSPRHRRSAVSDPLRQEGRDGGPNFSRDLTVFVIR